MVLYLVTTNTIFMALSRIKITDSVESSTVSFVNFSSEVYNLRLSKGISFFIWQSIYFVG